MPRSLTIDRRIRLYGFLALLGALSAILVSTPFSLAYFRAYGNSVGEQTPVWLAAFGSAYPSLLDFTGRIQVYQFYGRIYTLMIPLTLPGLFYLKSQIGTSSRLSHWGWRIFYSGVFLVGLGIFGEYCCDQNGFWISIGFFLDMLGTLVLGIGAIVYGIAVLREDLVPHWVGRLLIAITPVSILGSVLLQHIPSGSLFGYLIFWLVLGISLVAGKI